MAGHAPMTEMKMVPVVQRIKNLWQWFLGLWNRSNTPNTQRQEDVGKETEVGTLGKLPDIAKVPEAAEDLGAESVTAEEERTPHAAEAVEKASGPAVVTGEGTDSAEMLEDDSAAAEALEESMSAEAEEAQKMERERRETECVKYVNCLQMKMSDCLPFVHQPMQLNDFISHCQDILDKEKDLRECKNIAIACTKLLIEEAGCLYSFLCNLYAYKPDESFEPMVNDFSGIKANSFESLIAALEKFSSVSQRLSTFLITWMFSIRSSSQIQKVVAIYQDSIGIRDCYYLAERIIEMKKVIESGKHPSASSTSTSSSSASSSSASSTSTSSAALVFTSGYKGKIIKPYKSDKGGKGVGDFAAIHIHLVGGRNEHLKLSGNGSQIRITERKEMLSALRELVASPGNRAKPGYESCLRWLCYNLGFNPTPFTNIPEDKEGDVSNIS